MRTTLNNTPALRLRGAAALVAVTAGLVVMGAGTADAQANPAVECEPYEFYAKFDSPFMGANPQVGDSAGHDGVTITVTAVTPGEGVTGFDWDTMDPIARIVIKAGQSDTVIEPGFTNLGSVQHVAPPAISHVTFCTGDAPDEPSEEPSEPSEEPEEPVDEPEEPAEEPEQPVEKPKPAPAPAPQVTAAPDE